MAGHNLKSLSITNLDTVPVIAMPVGEGAPGLLRMANDSVTPVSADDTTSTYRLCRIPTNAKVKKLELVSSILTAGAADIDIAFSDSTSDGTQQAFATLANPVVQLAGPVDNKLFGAAQAIFAAAVGTRKEYTFLGAFVPAHQNIPLWSVLVALGATQFTSDPGGYFDIYVKVTTAITTGGVLSGEVTYME
jgi:hypothetical protein